jgi:hypothetical protein
MKFDVLLLVQLHQGYIYIYETWEFSMTVPDDVLKARMVLQDRQSSPVHKV